jgi:hypothetical protein
VDSQLADAFADAWTPPAAEPADEPWTPPAPEVDGGSQTSPAPEEDGGSWTSPAPEEDGGSWTSPAPEHEDVAAAFDVDEVEARESEPIVPIATEEVRPIFSNARDDSIVVEDEVPADEFAVDESPSDETVQAGSGGLTGVTSLSAAIRAAAEAAGTPSDDETQLLSEAANGGHHDYGVSGHDDGSLRRTVKSLVSPSSGGGFGDLSSRFRQAAAADSED